MPKSDRIPAFGDQFSRVPIASISGFRECDNGQIEVSLKSGGKMIFDFDIPFLSAPALARLDKRFDIEIPEFKACNVCVNKNVDDPETTGTLTYCNSCYNDRRHFKSEDGLNVDGYKWEVE